MKITPKVKWLLGVAVLATLIGLWKIPGWLEDSKLRSYHRRLQDFTLPTVADFIQEELTNWGRVRFLFTTTPLVRPGGYFASMPAYIIESDLDVPLGKLPRLLGTVHISTFHDDLAGEPKSIELRFLFQDRYKPRSTDGDWELLYNEAKAKGTLRTTWRDLEIVASALPGQEFQVVMRGRWPLTYFRQPWDHQARNTAKDGNPALARKATALIAATLKNASPGFDLQLGGWRDEGWVVMSDGRCFPVKAYLQGGKAVAHISLFHHLDLDTRKLVGKQLSKLKGIKLSGDPVEGFQFPADMDFRDAYKVFNPD